jgi:hypothetical protein
MHSIIYFLEGFISASILAGLVIWRCEKSCTFYIHVARKAGRAEGFVEGYNQRAKIAVIEREKQ